MKRLSKILLAAAVVLVMTMGLSAKADAAEWNTKAEDLASRFIKNFAKYEGNEHGKALVSAGPQL